MVTVKWRYNGEEYGVRFTNERWQQGIDALRSGQFNGCPFCLQDDNDQELCAECEIGEVATKMFPEYDYSGTSCCKLRSVLQIWDRAVLLSWRRAREPMKSERLTPLYHVISLMNRALKTGECRLMARDRGNSK